MNAMDGFFPALTNGAGHPHKWPAAMLICSQTEARRHGGAWAPTHIISIYGPQSRYLGLADFPAERHLHVRIEDTRTQDEPGAPTPGIIEAIMAFVDDLPADARLMIHCLQGFSRSTAVALGLLARYMPPDRAGADLYKLQPDAAPNPLLVSLWDRQLELGGKLVKASRKFPSQMLRRAAE
jgi:predicted protein tyrosine phosphatase